MAEAAVEPRRHAHRFFCHRCNVEFEDNIQDFTCPYCATGFIERLEGDRDADGHHDDGEYSDAEMSNIDDTSNADESVLDDSIEDGMPGPMLNDLAFLMSAGGVRNPGRRQESLMDHFLWMIGGGRAATGAVTAGAPFVLVGAPGDYVFGGEGLDAVVTQLLGQLENTGPPPLPREFINAIPNEQITAEQAEANMSCSVCWDNFILGETVSRLECSHIFHPACIAPWLQLHATCPICRRSLLPAQPEGAAPAPPAPQDSASSSSSTTTTQTDTGSTRGVRVRIPASYSRVVVRRLPAIRRRRSTQTAAGATPGAAGTWDTESSGSTGGLTPGGLWAHLTSSLASASARADSTSTSSLNSADRDRQYMDIDFD